MGALAPALASWLDAGPVGSPKHESVWHPFAAMLVGFGGIISTAVRSHDAIFADANEDCGSINPRFDLPGASWGFGEITVTPSWGLCMYIMFFAACRVPSLGLGRFLYESLWGCNVAMVLAALGFATGRARLVSAAGISVAIDQVLWWVDIIGFIFSSGSSWPVWAVLCCLLRYLCFCSAPNRTPPTGGRRQVPFLA